MATRLVESTSDPTTSNNSTTGYIDNQTRWRNTTTNDVFICVDAGAGTWEKIHDESHDAASGSIGYVDAVISTAEVKALNATPITVLSAVGAGVCPVFMGAAVMLDYGTAAYADDAGEDIVIQNLSGGDEVSQSADGSLFDGTADACVWLGPKGGDAITTATLVDNGGFEVTIQTGEWITGDSPLKIRLYYRTITTSELVAIA